MQISQQRLAYLLDAYSNGRASEDEVNELLDWARASNDPKPLNDFVQQLIDQYDPNEPTQPIDWEALYERIQRERGPAGISEASLLARQLPVERLPIRRISWFRATAAAAILLIASTIVLYKYNKNEPIAITTPPNTKPAPHTTPDIAPGADGAILTLANGQKIVLDSAGNGTLTTQGNTSLHNEHGQLSYTPTNTQQNEVLYNTITTTRGKQYQLRLADGSRVWLNASSSLKFPTAFTGDSRTVEVTGEAYFEVAPDASKPFKVRLHDGQEIQVLGTNFNVNAYEDEGATRTTLVDGLVKVIAPAVNSRAQASRLLHPGEQAQVGPTSINVTEKINIDEIIAWKEGLFLMKKADVASIMRQIARWYDVEVVYKGAIPSGRISGDIPRNMALSKVLEVMELSGIHFTVEGKKVIVSPG